MKLFVLLIINIKFSASHHHNFLVVLKLYPEAMCFQRIKGSQNNQILDPVYEGNDTANYIQQSWLDGNLNILRFYELITNYKWQIQAVLIVYKMLNTLCLNTAILQTAKKYLALNLFQMTFSWFLLLEGSFFHSFTIV